MTQGMRVVSQRPHRGRPAPWRIGVLSALLAAHAFLSLHAACGKSPVYDELGHLISGIIYWQRGDYRFQPENGNLPQRWAAAPVVLFTAVQLPPTHDPAWQEGDVWALQDRFLEQAGVPLWQVLLLGRCAALVWSLGTCVLVWWWATRLFGENAGLLALATACFEPTMLAHGPLITSDMCVSFWLLLSVTCLWQLLTVASLPWLAASLLSLGCVLVSKTSGLLIMPIAGVLVALVLLSRRAIRFELPGRPLMLVKRGVRLQYVLALIALHALVSWIIVWGFYGFRYQAASQNGDATWRFRDEADLPSLAARLPPHQNAVIQALGRRHLLPEGFLYGNAYVLHRSRFRPAFLNGQYSVTGWLSFFPYALAVKTPVPLLMLVTLGLAFAWKRRKQGDGIILEAIPLAALFAVYWTFALTSHLNIGHRHILPTYQVMYIVTGAAALCLAGKPFDSASTAGRKLPIAPAFPSLILALLTWQIVETLYRHPNYLAFFNELVGGPSKGHLHLVDSSLDWGQELPAIKAYFDTLPRSEQAVLAYFGPVQPQQYGIEAPTLPSRQFARIFSPLPPGTYVVSASVQAGLMIAAPGRWNLGAEQTYQALDQRMARIRALPPHARKDLFERDAESFCDLVYWYEQLRLARLMCYLRHRPEDLQINYSVLVHRLNASEVEQALHGAPAEMDAQPWHIDTAQVFTRLLESGP